MTLGKSNFPNRASSCIAGAPLSVPGCRGCFLIHLNPSLDSPQGSRLQGRMAVADLRAGGYDPPWIPQSIACIAHSLFRTKCTV